jgi:UDP-2,3-diacylglucosamine pyrophosphatase LpxH
VRDANPVAVDALEWLAARVPVTLVPGNHDRHLGEAGEREALDAVGLRHLRVEPTVVRTVEGRGAVFQHGHAWDPSNATPESGGEVMTSVLHHAVVPYLRHLAPRSNVRIRPDRIVSLRPEERVIPVLERWIRPGEFETFLDAFVELLVVNGSVSRLAALFATPERIRHRLKSDDDLWERSGHTALKALGGQSPIPGHPPPPDILVLGHTHILDWAVQEGRPGAQRLYVNLGTWTERASDASGPADVSLPLLEIGMQAGRLTAVLSDTSGDQHELERFEAPA